MLYANPRYFSTWAHGSNAKGNGRSRHDYDCPEHVSAEMMTEDYFGTLGDLLATGDLVHVSDAETAQMVIKIDWVDAKLRRVGFSVQERITERAVAGDDGLAVKYRGPRGGLWCVIDGEGGILAKDCRTRVEAERQRDIIKSSKQAA